MIKIGCNYLSLPDMDVETFIRTAYELKLDVVDFHHRAFASSDSEYLLGIKMLCLRLGLPVGYIGVGATFAGTDEQLRQKVAEGKEAIDIASFLGAPLIRVFGGHVPDGVQDREPMFGPMIGCFREMSDYGADKGVVVALQNHDTNNLAATAQDVLRILKETDHPNFSFILDTGQWAGSIGAVPKGEADPDVDIYEYMEETAPYAVYVRTKFYMVQSGREEWLDYERIVPILRGVSYNGSLSIVYEGQQPDRVDAVRKAASHLRELLAASPPS